MGMEQALFPKLTVDAQLLWLKFLFRWPPFTEWAVGDAGCPCREECLWLAGSSTASRL